MTLPRQLATIATYLIDIEQIYYNLGNKMELTEEENNTRENLHKKTVDFLTKFKIKALEDILKEEGENGN